MRISKLSILLLRSYTGPFIVTFLVAMFIFEMQFIWLYVDDMMGKGLGPGIIFQLLVYASARIVNMALPLAILMSSIMTMGALAENNELTAMKSSGTSLFRIMRPLVVFTVGLALVSFFFANNVWPIANLKFRTMLYSVMQQRPALHLENGVFYKGIEGISIRVMQKNPETGDLYDVLIYDHRGPGRGNSTVIRARRGTMGQTEDKRYLLLTLYDGHSYDEQDEDRRNQMAFPLIRSTFDEMILRLDLSAFAFNQNDEEIFRSSYEMMTSLQLTQTIKILRAQRDSMLTADAVTGIRRIDFSGVEPDEEIVLGEWFLDELSPDDQHKAVIAAIDASRRSRDQVTRNRDELESRNKFIRRHQVEWHRKFILGVACIVLFFVGAPLGAIIRKGGLGLPTVIALALFIVFHLLTMAGEKMAKSGITEVWFGLWLSTMLMFPLSIWLTYKASREAVLFDRDTYLKILRVFDLRNLLPRRRNAQI